MNVCPTFGSVTDPDHVLVVLGVGWATYNVTVAPWDKFKHLR